MGVAGRREIARASFAYNPEAHVDVLRIAAEAVAEALAGTSSCLEASDWRLQLLEELFLAESEDASVAAAATCKLLRRNFAEALHRAISARPDMEHLVAGKPRKGSLASGPPVRVEVRGTAGRRIVDATFSVGRSPYCDVEAFGDDTVVPLQCLVVSLPGSIVVVDAWSVESTRVTWRWGSQEKAPPKSLAPQSGVFVFEHGERAILRIGAQTTVALGPKQASRQKRASPKLCPSTPKRLVRKNAVCSTPQKEQLIAASPRKRGARGNKAAISHLSTVYSWTDLEKAFEDSPCSTALLSPLERAFEDSPCSTTLTSPCTPHRHSGSRDKFLEELQAKRHKAESPILSCSFIASCGMQPAVDAGQRSELMTKLFI